MDSHYSLTDGEATVALQGTLDTFAFADVLRLLASTGKSGRLELDGDRGTGRVWFGDGELVGGEAPDCARADELADVVFQMLRFEEGSFLFDAGALPDSPEGPFAVDQVIDDAEAKLAEWREIETVVPSMHHQLSLAPEVDDDATVSLDAEEWRLVAALGGDVTVDALGERLQVPDLVLCRTVKELVERGLVSVGEEVDRTGDLDQPDADDEAEPAGEPMTEFDQADDGDDNLDVVSEVPAEGSDSPDYFADGAGSHSARARLDVMAASYSAEESGANQALLPEPLPTDASAEEDRGEPAPVAQAEPVEPSEAEVPELGTEPEWTAEDDEQMEINRQLASLSPKAAEAIAAAASSLKGEDLHAGRNRLRTRSSSLRR